MLLSISSAELTFCDVGIVWLFSYSVSVDSSSVVKSYMISFDVCCVVDGGWNTSSIWDHSVIHGKASILTPVSSEMISASDDECDMADCFLHSHEMGTNVLDPIKHNIPPDVDLLSLISLAKLASANKCNAHSSIVFPTKQHCDQCLV